MKHRQFENSLTQLFARVCHGTCQFLAGTPSPHDTACPDQGDRLWAETQNDENYNSKSPTIPRRRH